MNTIEFARPAARDRRRETIALPTDRLWTVRQAATFLGRSVSWVYKAAERNELPRARGMGWGLRFVPGELYAYARGDMSAPSAMVRRRKGGAWLMASVLKRGGVWYAKWTDASGKPRREPTQASSKAEAKALADELEVEARRHRNLMRRARNGLHRGRRT